MNSQSPNWTVLYNIVSDDSDFIGTGWEFFVDKDAAEKCFEKQISNGNCPTMRPYYKVRDASHLGAAHRLITQK